MRLRNGSPLLAVRDPRAIAEELGALGPALESLSRGGFVVFHKRSQLEDRGLYLNTRAQEITPLGREVLRHLRAGRRDGGDRDPQDAG